jgi:hypothetical protein
LVPATRSGEPWEEQGANSQVCPEQNPNERI